MEKTNPEIASPAAESPRAGRRADGGETAAELLMTRVVEMVDKLAQGDPAVRLSIDSDDPLTNALVQKFNRLAESLQGMVEESHEMAIGLCEHYDALNRIAAGNLACRAPVDSSNELIAKLGELINRSAASVAQTIEELQVKDQALMVANDTLSNIIEFLPDATFVIDRDKRLIAWNRAMEVMTGVSKSEILGSSDYSVPFYGRRRPVLVDLLDMERAELGDSYSYIERKGASLFAEAHIPNFRGASGIYLWLTASPLLDSSGSRVGAIESARDISNLKETEEENARLLEQLRQAQKMEAIGQLAGGVAHDFNNILTAIVGYSHLITLKAGDASACKRYGELIIDASSRAAKLTDDMLAFGRRQALNAQVCDLNDVILSMKEMLRCLIGEEINLAVVSAGKPLWIMADVGQIQQVLMNLVTNARDAMPQGGRLTIRSRQSSGETGADSLAAPSEGGRGWAIFTVGDSGVGMTAAIRQKIFEPFFTTKVVGKGTGLGLAMVFGIIAQHGGSIDVESEPGHGTTIFVRLPIVEELPGGPEESIPATVPEAAGNSDTILLVEDNEITREVLREILEDAGYKVLIAIDGEEAVAIYREKRQEIDLLLLDVIMPRMNGRETLEGIRRLCPPVRYLFMSGYTADLLHSKGEVEEELNFIAKPVIAEEFLRKVRSVLDGVIQP